MQRGNLVWCNEEVITQKNYKVGGKEISDEHHMLHACGH